MKKLEEKRMKKKLFLFISIIFMLMLAACSSNDSANEGNNEAEGKETENVNVLDKDFEQILEAAKGTTVNFYGYGGGQKTNEWIDGFLAENMKEKYDITVNRVGMNIDEILNILLNE